MSFQGHRSKLWHFESNITIQDTITLFLFLEMTWCIGRSEWQTCQFTQTNIYLKCSSKCINPIILYSWYYTDLLQVCWGMSVRWHMSRRMTVVAMVSLRENATWEAAVGLHHLFPMILHAFMEYVSTYNNNNNFTNNKSNNKIKIIVILIIILNLLLADKTSQVSQRCYIKTKRLFMKHHVVWINTMLQFIWSGIIIHAHKSE